jgi:predicted dienelactone hydrolase
MSYDPFARGPLPVGVRTIELTDSSRGRTLPLEVWYPAGEAHAGADLAEDTKDRYRILPIAPEVTQDAVRDAAARPGRHPLIVFSHGWGGHRRQTTHFCTHLASHGYVVVAPDHVGNTMLDVMQFASTLQSGVAPPDPTGMAHGLMEDRRRDVPFLLDSLLEAVELAASIDAERVGAAGHSFGGWTTLSAVANDPRIRAALPLAPAGGKTGLAAADALAAGLAVDWARDVPTLFLVAERDTILPLEGMHDLFSRTPEPKRMVVLENADHLHYCDRVEEVHELFRMMGSLLLGTPAAAAQPEVAAVVRGIPPASELCPGEHAYQYLRSLGLAHMDAHVKGLAEAADWLAQDLEALFAARGIAVDVI